jgi:arylsulfatase A-like enzyme
MPNGKPNMLILWGDDIGWYMITTQTSRENVAVEDDAKMIRYRGKKTFLMI